MKNIPFVWFSFIFAYCFMTNHVMGNIILPSLISDNMVIQQNAPVHIWGKANVGEPIQLSILDQQISLFADETGHWETWLMPMKSNKKVNLTIIGSDTITIKNISETELWDVEGQWEICSPSSIENFSAVGYFFGRELYKNLRQPIGLIEASWGGTKCQSWTPGDALQSDCRLQYVDSVWVKYVESYPERERNYQAALERWQTEKVKAEAEDKVSPRKPREAKIDQKNKPSVIYNAMIAPLINYTIKGVIWYQGESNAYKDVSYKYRFLFPTMINAWRDKWKQGDFPFLYVQLSTLYKHPYWPVLRESQTETLKLRNTAMAVSFDVGDSTNAHYKNKQEIGRRLALAARGSVYGEKVNYIGPMYRQMTIEGEKIRVWFDHSKGLKTSDNSEPQGFVIAGKDGRFFPACAKIEGETIVLTSSEVKNPKNARYAFKDAPVANIVNKSGLPAVPFRTDIKDGL